MSSYKIPEETTYIHFFKKIKKTNHNGKSQKKQGNIVPAFFEFEKVNMLPDHPRI